MTNKNYTQMSNEELLDEINSFGVYPSKIKIFISNHFPKLMDEIVSRTSFLDDNSSIHARLYCIKHNIQEHPVCIGNINGVKCTNKVIWDVKKHSFRLFCSSKCAQNDENVRQKCKDTCVKKFGCDNPSKNSDIKIKISQQWGQKSASELDEIRQKRINTSTERHGGVGFQSKSITQKIEETNLKRYNVRNASSARIVRDSVRKTCIDRLGVENPMQSETIRNKVKRTCQTIYGVENVFQSDEIKRRICDTNNRKYGVPSPMQHEEIKQKLVDIMMKKHGGIGLGSKNIYQKIHNTISNKYGHEHYTQCSEYHTNKRHKYITPKYPNMSFDSNWEIDVYDFLSENHINFEYQPSIVLYFWYDGKIRTYHPDFKVGEKLIEVKGDNFFRINESTGKEEMFCPYRYPEWTDEYYEWVCGLYEAKHQCIIENSILIIRKYEIEHLTLQLFQLNGK